MTDAAPIPDGDYDALVIDAEDLGDDTTLLCLTVVSGPRKGEVVEMRGPRVGSDPLDLLGLPAVVRVRDGRPAVQIER